MIPFFITFSIGVRKTKGFNGRGNGRDLKDLDFNFRGHSLGSLSQAVWFRWV